MVLYPLRRYQQSHRMCVSNQTDNIHTRVADRCVGLQGVATSIASVPPLEFMIKKCVFWGIYVSTVCPKQQSEFGGF